MLITLKKIIKTLVSRIRVFLRIGDKEVAAFWSERGINTELLDVQIDGYENKYRELNEVLEEIKQDVANELESKIHPGARFMDYGCGTGRYIEVFYSYEGIDVLGVDLSRSILDNYTRRKFPQGKFLCLDLVKEKQIIKEFVESFDAIYCISVIQYVKPWELPVLLEKLKDMLKTDGLLYLHFPHPNSRWDIISDLSYIRYTPDKVEKHLKSIGFNILKSYSFIHNKKVHKIDKSGLPNYGYVVLAQKS